MSDTLTSTVFGYAGGDPSTDYNPWGSGPPVGGYAPTTTGSNQTTILSSIDPNAGRVDPHAVIEFDNFLGNALASGTSLDLLSQFTPLVNLDANATDGLSGLGNVAPRLRVSGQEIVFQNTTQLYNFLQRSAGSTASESSQVQSIALSTLGSELDANTAATYATQIARGTSPAQVQVELARSPQSATNITNFFQQIYMRPPTGYEISQYQTFLCTQSLFSARSLAAHGPEAAAFIQGQFLNVLNRNATATEIAAGENGLTAGQSELDLRSTLAHSPEEYNALNNAFIAATGAPGSSLEIANYQNSIAYSPNSQETVRSWIAYSPTTVQQIYQIYQNLFQSQPSSADLGAREASIQAGATLANLTQSLAQYAGSNVNQVYWNIVGRAPLASEVSGGIANLAGGGTLSQAEGWLAASNECQNAVNNIFVSILNHSSDWNTLIGYQNSLAGGNSLTVERSWVAYGADAQNEIIGNFQDEVGTTPSSSQIGQYEAFFNSGGNLPGLWSALSQQSAPLITTIFGNEFGRAPTASEVTANEGYFAAGATQSNLLTSLASTPEIANDVATAYLQVTGTQVDATSQATYQNDLGFGGNIATVGSAVLNSDQFQNNLDNTYDAVLSRDASPAELSSLTTELSSELPSSSSTWQNLVSTISNGFIKFLNEVNPIGSALAAASETSAVQQMSNLATVENLAANPSIMKFIHTLSGAELHSTFNPSTSYYVVNGGQTVNSLTAFPTSTGGSSAAGAYQTLLATYKAESSRLGLHDFVPRTQDLIAIDLLNQSGGAAALVRGDLPTAINDASRIWAALPQSSQVNHSRYMYVAGVHKGQYQPSIDYQTFVSHYQTTGSQ